MQLVGGLSVPCRDTWKSRKQRVPDSPGHAPGRSITLGAQGFQSPVCTAQSGRSVRAGWATVQFTRSLDRSTGNRSPVEKA